MGSSCSARCVVADSPARPPERLVVVPMWMRPRRKVPVVMTTVRAVDAAHFAFAQRPKDAIPAEVVVLDEHFRRIDGPRFGVGRGNRTVDGAHDQTLRTQPSGITGAQSLSALRAG